MRIDVVTWCYVFHNFLTLSSLLFITVTQPTEVASSSHLIRTAGISILQINSRVSYKEYKRHDFPTLKQNNLCSTIKTPRFSFYSSVPCAGPSPGFSSSGAKNQKGGPHFKNTVLDVCSNQEPKREMGGTDFKWGGPGTTGPPAGDGPGLAACTGWDIALRTFLICL